MVTTSTNRNGGDAGSGEEHCEEAVCQDMERFIKAGQRAFGVRGGAPDRVELGRATWAFLHTTAAYYPEKPNEKQQHAAEALVESLAVLYACSDCRQHLQSDLAHHGPLDTSSRSSWSRGLCQLHNRVNERLGKPQFDCGKVVERWRGDLKLAAAKANKRRVAESDKT